MRVEEQTEKQRHESQMWFYLRLAFENFLCAKYGAGYRYGQVVRSDRQEFRSLVKNYTKGFEWGS